MRWGVDEKLAPVSPARARGHARCPFAKDEPTLGQVIRRHFDDHPIANDRTDLETPHLARRIGDDAMVVIQTDGKASVRKNFLDLAVKGKKFFLGHPRLGGLEIDR